jgi:hypothetical protein
VFTIFFALAITQKQWLNTEGELMRVVPAKHIVAPAMHGANIAGGNKRKFSNSHASMAQGGSMSKEVFVEYFDHSIAKYSLMSDPVYMSNLVHKCIESDRGQSAIVSAVGTGIQNNVGVMAQCFRQEFGGDFDRMGRHMEEFNRIMDQLVLVVQAHFGVSIQNHVNRKRHQSGQAPQDIPQDQLMEAQKNATSDLFQQAVASGQARMHVDNPMPPMVAGQGPASNFNMVANMAANPLGYNMAQNYGVNSGMMPPQQQQHLMPMPQLSGYSQ